MKTMDIEAMERVLAEIAEKLKPQLVGGTFDNVLARCQIAVGAPMTRWRVKEVADGRNRADVMRAICCFVSATMISELMTVTQNDREQMAKGANAMMAEIAQYLQHGINSAELEKVATYIDPIEGGRA